MNLRLEEIFTTDSIYLCAKKCASGFRYRYDTNEFMQSAWVNSYKLCQEVLSGRFTPKYYRERTFRERGKVRKIKPPTFRSKVVQKALCEYCIRDILEKRMIRTSYASIRGGGTDRLYEDVLKGVNKAGRKLNKPVIIQTDYSSFFPSIDNRILKDYLRRYIDDERVVSLILSFSDGDIGLSLGNETSQVPASYFPSAIDHEFKDRMGVKFYYRYMDDVLFICEEKEADALTERFIQLSEAIGLRIKDEKIKKTGYGRKFVCCKELYLFNKEEGYYYRHINPQVIRTESRKLRKFAQKYEAGEMTKSDIDSQYKGVRGFIKSKPNTYKAVEKLDREYKDIWQKEEKK